MQPSKFLLAIAATVGVSCSVAAQSRYDFSYTSSDPRILAFDDGGQTRIQLPEGVLLPTVVATQTQGDTLVPLRREGPYLVGTGVFQRITLRWGNAHQVSIQYTGNAGLGERNGPAAAYGSAPPQAVYSSAARPVAVVQTAARTATAPAVVAAAVPPLTVAEPQAASFDFLTSDRTISGSIRRWAKTAGYELVWELPEELDPVIRRPSGLRGVTAMNAALELVQTGLRAKGYAVDVRLYSDRVIHFTLAGQPS